MIFWSISTARMRAPILSRTVLGQVEVQQRHQTGILRLHNGDRLTPVEERDDYSLCEHASVPHGVVLVKTEHLREEAAS